MYQLIHEIASLMIENVSIVNPLADVANNVRREKNSSL